MNEDSTNAEKLDALFAYTLIPSAAYPGEMVCDVTKVRRHSFMLFGAAQTVICSSVPCPLVYGVDMTCMHRGTCVPIMSTCALAILVCAIYACH